VAIVTKHTDDPASQSPELNAGGAAKPLAQRIGRFLAIAVLLGAALLLASLGSNPGAKDFIAYWSSAHLFAQHENPYSPARILAMEHEQGYAPHRPLLMLNPPSALFLVLPLGWVGPRLGFFLWSSAAVGCLVLSLEALEVAPSDRILAFFFAPFFACLSAGQSSPFLLLGLSLFLRFQRSRPLAAGAALALMAIKPLLFLALWPLVLVDCLYRRNYRVLAAGTVTVGVAALLPLLRDPQVWPQYLAMVHQARLDAEFLPVPALLLRLLLAPAHTWLQFLPCVAAMAWGLWYYWRNRAEWCWRVHGIPVVLVTLLAAPFAWTTDEIIAMPAMMAALASATRPRHAVALYAVLNGVVIVMMSAQYALTSPAYIWTSSAWLVFYLYCCRGKAIPPQMEPCEQ
jgi:hypothetical protein